MASSHDFDPAKGFVALPSDVMDIEMSPGAFRLLVELCRMANRTGECWPSLAQLSERIGRSKAAISGYITELREIELVETISQKMANGYNYRLKYCVTFWKNWRTGLSQASKETTLEKPKRSIQPSERRVNSKNHIHKNHSIPSTEKPLSKKNVLLESVLENWMQLTKASPFPRFNDAVPDELVQQTSEIIEDAQLECASKDRIAANLDLLWSKLSVELNPQDLKKQTDVLYKRQITENGLDALKAAITDIWQSHWRKAPTEKQFEEILKNASALNREEGILRMLQQYLKRWEISQNKLHHPTHSPNLMFKQVA